MLEKHSWHRKMYSRTNKEAVLHFGIIEWYMGLEVPPGAYVRSRLGHVLTRGSALGNSEGRAEVYLQSTTNAVVQVPSHIMPWNLQSRDELRDSWL